MRLNQTRSHWCHATCRTTMGKIQGCHSPVWGMGRLAHLKGKGKNRSVPPLYCQESSVVLMKNHRRLISSAAARTSIFIRVLLGKMCFGMLLPCIWERDGISAANTKDTLSGLVTACSLPLHDSTAQCWRGKFVSIKKIFYMIGFSFLFLRI